VSSKEGFVHVPNCKSVLVTEAERKHVRRRARFQQRGDENCHQVFFRQNRVAQVKRGDFSTCDVPRPVRPKIVTTPEINDQIHELILEDCRISAK